MNEISSRSTTGRPLPRERASGAIDALPVLLDRIAAGEQAALAELYDLTVAQLFRLAALIVRDRQDAEEVVCDTFTQVWRSAHEYDPSRGTALAWLLMICRSRAVDRRRRNRSGLPVSCSGAAAGAEASQEFCHDEVLQALEQDSAIRRAISKLPPLQWRLISLAFFQGLTHHEIARDTSLPVGTVKSHIRRALAAMRAELQSGSDGAYCG